jgi:hypothetical protein
VRDDTEGLQDPVGSLIGDGSSRIEESLREGGLQLLLLPGKEPNELKRRGRQSGEHEGVDEGTGARKGGDSHPFCPTPRDEFLARVGDQRRARIGDEGESFATFKILDDPVFLFCSVKLVERFEGDLDLVVVEKMAAVASVFAEDIVAGFQHTHCPPGEISEVADRRGNEIEHVT